MPLPLIAYAVLFFAIPDTDGFPAQRRDLCVPTIILTQAAFTQTTTLFDVDTLPLSVVTASTIVNQPFGPTTTTITTWGSLDYTIFDTNLCPSPFPTITSTINRTLLGTLTQTAIIPSTTIAGISTQWITIFNPVSTSIVQTIQTQYLMPVAAVETVTHLSVDTNFATTVFTVVDPTQTPIANALSMESKTHEIKRMQNALIVMGLCLAIILLGVWFFYWLDGKNEHRPLSQGTPGIVPVSRTQMEDIRPPFVTPVASTSGNLPSQSNSTKSPKSRFKPGTDRAWRERFPTPPSSIESLDQEDVLVDIDEQPRPPPKDESIEGF